MITGLTAGKYLTVSGSAGTYYNNTGQPAAGTLRYHSGGKVDVFDGVSWMQVGGYQSIDLSVDAQAALEWAMMKRREEQELERLAKESPAVKAAYENVKRAEEQLKTTIILSKDEESTT